MRSHRRIALTLLAATLAACGSGISLDEPIEGPTWRLVRLGDQPVDSNADPQRGAQIQFDRSSGRVTGSGGCNRISGTFQRSGYDLRMGQLASTRMACTDPVRGENEMQFFAALQTTASYRLQGPSRLVLLDAGGRTLVTLDALGR
jgi:putative lipoprotein